LSVVANIASDNESSFVTSLYYLNTAHSILAATYE